MNGTFEIFQDNTSKICCADTNCNFSHDSNILKFFPPIFNGKYYPVNMNDHNPQPNIKYYFCPNNEDTYTKSIQYYTIEKTNNQTDDCNSILSISTVSNSSNISEINT
jgi:hypothetical protein